MQKSIRAIRWITFSALLVTAVAFLFPFIDWTSSNSITAGVLIILAAALLTWALETWLKFLLEQIGGSSRSLVENAGSLPDLESTILFDASRAFISARTKSEIVEIVMNAGFPLLKATGASFTSFEEWNFPLPINTIGDVPSEVNAEWSKRLSHPATRQACRKCNLRESGESCILSQNTSNPYLKVFCLPICEGQRECGLINYFFHSPVLISESKRKFFVRLSDLADSALRGISQCGRGNEALRYLELSAARRDFSSNFFSISEKIKNALQLKWVVLWSPKGDLDVMVRGPFETVSNGNNGFNPIEDSLALDLWKTIVETRQSFTREVAANNNPEKIGIIAVPIAEAAEMPIGMMICVFDGSNHESMPHLPLLQVIAQEIAIFHRSIRFTEQLEYRAARQERYHLAREIHDGLAQNLAYLKIQTAQMFNDFHTGNMVRLESSLSESYLTLSATYLDVRREIDDLRFEADADSRDWLKKIALGFQKESGIVVDLSRMKLDVELPLAVRTQLIRIVQEALNNVRKHAQAENVAIIGDVYEGEVVIEVSDDGRGFAPDQVEIGSRFGLVGMRERTELVGGEFQIISRQNVGTIVRVIVPLETKS